MTLSEETKKLLSTLNEMSGHRLQRSLDLARLIDLSRDLHRQPLLDDLAFRAKFIIKSFDVMKRIGLHGEGYEKLSAEFTGNVQRCQELIAELTDGAPEDIRSHFTGTYGTAGGRTMEDLMQLFHDLSWYKNYQIDTKRTKD